MHGEVRANQPARRFAEPGLVVHRVCRAKHLHVRTQSGLPHAVAVEIKLVLLRVLVVLNHGGEVLERARAVARARVAPPRFVLEPRALHVVQVGRLVAVAREERRRALRLFVLAVL